MFTLTVRDERVYRQLMERVEQRGESLDEVLRELLDHKEDTPARKLVKLIDAADLPSDHAFDARDAEAILSRETGEASWRAVEDEDGSA